MSQQLARLFFLSCELRPAMPDAQLGRMLGKAWWPLVDAGSKVGLAGTVTNVAGVSADSVQAFYMMGAESGATPTLDEFYSGFAGVVFEKITTNSDLSARDQIKLISKLETYVEGRESHNGDGNMDFDAEVETPMFTKTGFNPFDRILGEDGAAQGVHTLLAKPEQGKTTVLMSIACEWRRNSIGSVHFFQTELAPSQQIRKLGMMTQPGEKLWRSGVDQLIFGTRSAEIHMKWLIDNPDPDRLIIFDSIGAHCGGGDTPDSRNRFFQLYLNFMAMKNQARMVIAAGHVKRGCDMYDIESAAGSAAIERYSDSLIFIDKDPDPYPLGRNSIRIQTTKNRYHQRVRPFDFIYDYKTGLAYDENEVPDAEELE